MKRTIAVLGSLLALLALYSTRDVPPTAIATASTNSHKLASESASTLAPATPEVHANPRPSSHSTDSTDPIRDFRVWTDTFLNAAHDQRAGMLHEGLQLAEIRRIQLKQLIQDDPEKALRAAIPFALRLHLPAEIVPLLESHVSGRAPLTVLYAKPPDGQPCTTRTTIRFARLNDAFYNIYAYGRRQIPASLPLTVIIGIAVDDQLALSDQPYRLLESTEANALHPPQAAHPPCPVCGRNPTSDAAPAVLDVGGQTVALCDESEIPAYFQTPEGTWIWADGGTGGTGVPSPVNPATSTQGELRFLFMRVRFADESSTAEPSADSRVRSDLDAVMRSYAEMSYGTLQGRYAFTPTLTLPKNRSRYLNGWSDVDGMTALMIDAKAAAAAWVENGQRPYHPANFDLFAARWNGEPGGCCSYGGGGNTWIRWDGPDVLVHEWGHAIGLPHAGFWIPSTDDPIGPGTHDEYGNSFDAMGSGGSRHFSAMFKAQLNWLPATNYWNVTNSGTYRIFAHDQAVRTPANRYGAKIDRISRDHFSYWLEYRANTVTGTDESLWTNGVTLTRTFRGHLLDTTPGSSRGRDDSSLIIARTYSDTRAGIHVTPIARSVSGQPFVDVVVSLDDGRKNHAPVNVLSASTTTPTPGTSVQLGGLALDPDGDSLAYHWDFGDGTFSLNNLPTQTKSYSTTGVFVVRCTVSDRRGGLAVDSIAIRAGTSADYSIAGRVLTREGTPVAQAMIHDSNGRIAWSGSDGAYTLGRLPAGTHILSAFHAQEKLNPPFVTVTVPASIAGVDFTAPSTASLNRGLRREHWLNLNGSTLTSLTTSPRYPNNPDGAWRVADAFEGPLDWADNYGARYRGYFIPPLSGGYVFYIASDDASELRLSRDESTTAPVRIAYVAGFTSDRNWIATASQKSPLLQLAAGQRYYIEALHKEGGGGDHLAVGVDLPDGTQERPVPFHRFEAFATNAPSEFAHVSVQADIGWAIEAGTGDRFIFTRTGSTEESLDVFYLLRGAANYGTDYSATGLRATIPAGAQSVSVSVNPINDAVAETPERVTAILTDGPGYLAVAPASAAIDLLDNDGQPTVSIVATTPFTARNGSVPGQFTARRTGSPLNPLTVNLSLGGSAVNGTDYERIATQLTFPAGAGTATIEIRPVPAAGLLPPKIAQIALVSGTGYTLVAPTSASVTITQPGPGFGFVREWWTGITGGTIPSLTNSAQFPNNPSGREYLNTVLEGPRDWADDYGERCTALFVAPATGNYYFSIASDDGGELWIGTNALASSRRRVAWVNGYVAYRAWTAQSNQRSTAQALVAGRRYYLEALHTEGGGGDHLSVGVQMPNNVSEFPITPQWLEPYSASGPLVFAETTAPDASESGRVAHITLRRTGEPTNALPLRANLTGTATFGNDYTLSPSLGSAPFWLRAERVGPTLNSYASPDGSNWLRTASLTLANPPSTLLVGLAVATLNNSVLSTSTFDNVTVTGPTAPWASQNIGTVGPVGSTTVAENLITVVASGGGIAGTTDSFRYVFRAVTGDAQITARVSSQSALDPAAKSGVMIRDGLDSGARHLLIATTPRSFAASVTRATANGNSTLTNSPILLFAPGHNARDVAITALADATSEGVESATLNLLAGTGYSLGYSDSATVFIASDPPAATFSITDASASETSGNSATFRVALSSPAFGPVRVRYRLDGTASTEDYAPASGELTIPAGQTAASLIVNPLADSFLEQTETLRLSLVAGPGYLIQNEVSGIAELGDATPGSLPSPWSSDSIGNTGLGGGVAPLTSGFHVAGAGLGFASNLDSLQFLSRPLGTQSALTVSLLTQRSTDPLAAAGIMIRSALSPDAPYAFLGHTPSRGLVRMDRTAPGSSATERFIANGSAPRWLRLVRSGEVLSAYYSDEATQWTHFGNVTLPGLPETARFGLAVTSRDLTTNNVATFPTVVVHTPFALTTITNRSAPVGSPIGPIPLRILSDTASGASFRFTADVHNSPVLATSGVQFEGIGPDRTITLTPSGGLAGSAYVTVVAHDGVFQSESSFTAQWGTPVTLQARLNNTASILEIAWPESLDGASLLFTPSLTPPITWTAVANIPSVVNGQRQVSLPAIEASRFYRLQLP